MAKTQEKALISESDAVTLSEQRRIAEAEFMLRKRNKHYRPIPKFKGCKNC